MSRKRNFAEGYTPKGPVETRIWEEEFRNGDSLPFWLHSMIIVVLHALPLLYLKNDPELNYFNDIIELIKKISAKI